MSKMLRFGNAECGGGRGRKDSIHKAFNQHPKGAAEFVSLKRERDASSIRIRINKEDASNKIQQMKFVFFLLVEKNKNFFNINKTV